MQTSVRTEKLLAEDRTRHIQSTVQQLMPITSDVNSFLGLSFRLDVGEVACVSSVHFVPIFRVVMCRLASFCVHIALCLETQHVKTILVTI